MLKIILMTTIVVITGSKAWSQNSRSEKHEQAKETFIIPYSEKKSSSKKQLHAGYKTAEDLQKEYYERVEAVVKARRKAERLMQKPQYSNPMYFGHKRLPRKHTPKKMRYCSECGIRH